MQRIAELAVSTVWGARGPAHHERQRSTAACIVTLSNGNPSRSACTLDSIRQGPWDRADARGLPAMRGFPRPRSLLVELARRGRLAQPQARMLVTAQELAEAGLLVPRRALERAGEIAPEHRDAAVHGRVLGQPVERDRQVVERGSPHEVLAEAGPDAPRPDALALAGPHRAQVEEAEIGIVHALRDPAQHARAVAVDPVPHDLPYEAADLAEASDPVELGHPHRHLVAADFGDALAGARMDEPGFSRAGPETRLPLHPPHQELEVAGWQIEVHVELAEVVVVVEVEALQAL